MRQAIEAGNGSPARIATKLGCARSTVYAYIRRYPELKAAFEGSRGAVVEDRRHYPHEALVEAIRQSEGYKARVAAALGCSRQTVDNYFRDDPDLHDAFEAERAKSIGLATSKLMNDVKNGDQKAYMYLLKTIGKDEGFTERSEVSGKDGAPLLEFTPEQIKLLETHGTTVQQQLNRLFDMLRMYDANGASHEMKEVE